MSYEEDTCVPYEEEDTCVSYEEEDPCFSLIRTLMMPPCNTILALMTTPMPPVWRSVFSAAAALAMIMYSAETGGSSTSYMQTAQDRERQRESCVWGGEGWGGWGGGKRERARERETERGQRYIYEQCVGEYLYRMCSLVSTGHTECVLTWPGWSQCERE